MKQKFPEFLKHDHSPHAINERLRSEGKKNFLRDFVYGAIDGTVTTFAIVAGVKGAELSHATILIMGLSNIVADGFSMAAGNYLGSKVENDHMALLKDYETSQTFIDPEGEKEEIRQIFREKGFEGDLLEKVVDVVVSDREQWVKMMLTEEYGVDLRPKSPMMAGLVTFLAFILFGSVPLLPFVLNLDDAFYYSTFGAAISFFILGALKSLWSLKSKFVSGLETFIIGGAAASVAYFIGDFLKNLGV